MDYRHSADSGSFQKWEKAFQATCGKDIGVEDVYIKLFTLPAVVILTLGLSLLIAFANPLIALGIAAHGAMPCALAGRAQRYAYSRKEEESKQARRSGVYARCGLWQGRASLLSAV